MDIKIKAMAQIFLAPSLFSTEEAHLAKQKVCEELKHKLSTTEEDRQNQYLEMTAEIDDLNRTKTNLEERLIELIRYDWLQLIHFLMNQGIKVNFL